MGSEASVDAIVMAAGASKRFGRDKRLHSIQGVPMLQKTLSSVLPNVRKVYVALRDSDRKQLPLLFGSLSADDRIVPLLLENPQSGMGSNLARAIESLPQDCDAVLVVLADLPYLCQQTVCDIVQAYEVGKIVVPFFLNKDGIFQQGHPVLFSRRFFPELQSLRGDNGARSVLRDNEDAVLQLVVQDGGVLRDVDVLSDL